MTINKNTLGIGRGERVWQLFILHVASSIISNRCQTPPSSTQVELLKSTFIAWHSAKILFYSILTVKSSRYCYFQHFEYERIRIRLLREVAKGNSQKAEDTFLIGILAKPILLLLTFINYWCYTVHKCYQFCPHFKYFFFCSVPCIVDVEYFLPPRNR